MDEVTAVVPFFNGNQYLSEALTSICQKYVHEIIIVVDQGSEEPVFHNIPLDVRVLYNIDPNVRGAGVCRALGFEASKSKYVAFLDCDDRWEKNKIEKQVKFMEKSNLAFSFHTYQHFSASSRIYQPVVPLAPYTLDNFYKKRFTIGCLTVLINKEKVPSLPKVTIKRRNDYVMWNYVIKYCEDNGYHWGGLRSEPMAFHRLHDNALTSSRLMSAVFYFRFLRISGNSAFCSLYYFFHYFWYTIGTR